MNIPDFIQSPVGNLEKDFNNNQVINLSSEWQFWFDQLITELQNNVGQEGFTISNLSSDPSSVNPPKSGGQVGIVESGASLGTIIYDTFTNQLKVKKPSGFVVIV